MEQFEKIKERASNAGCLEQVEQLESMAKKIVSSNVKNIAIIGETNCGKTTLLNMLIGSEAKKPTTLSSNQSPLMVTFDRKIEREGFETMYIESKKCKNLGISLSEIPINLAIDTESGAPTPFLEMMDIVIYVVSAPMPFTSADVQNLKAFANRLPCIIVVSKTSLLANDEEKKDVVTYVQSKYEEKFGKGLLLIMGDSASDLFNSFSEYITELNIDELREFHVMQLLAGANNIIRKSLKNKLESIREKKEDIIKSNIQNAEKFREQQLEWQSINIDMREKQQETISNIEKKIRTERELITGRLLAELKKNDYSDRWIKIAFSDKMNDEMNNLAQEIIIEMEDKIKFHIDWLINEIDRRFSKKILLDEFSMKAMSSFFGTISNYEGDTQSQKSTLAIGSGIVAGVAVVTAFVIPTTWFIAVPATIVTAILAKETIDDKVNQNRLKSDLITEYCKKNCKQLLDNVSNAVERHYLYMIDTIKTQSNELELDNCDIREIDIVESAIIGQLKLCDMTY